MSVLSIIFAFLLVLMISEPKRLKSSNSNEKIEPILKQMKSLVIKVYETIKKNPNLLIGWLFIIPAGAPMAILEIYIIR